MATEIKTVFTAENPAHRIYQQVVADMAGLEKSAGWLRDEVALLAPQIAAAFAGFSALGIIRSSIDAIDKLNDLSDATGASIENLSGLEDIAARTGTSMETAGDAVIKLNKALNEARDPNSDAAAAIKRIGLSVQELKSLDPVIALQRVGQALRGFADDGAKGRLELILLGRQTKDMAKFLGDLADAGKINATTTTEQAKAANQFNNELAALQKNAADAARALVSDMVPGLNKFFDTIKHGGPVLPAIDELVGFKEQRALSSEIELLTRDITNLKAAGADNSWWGKFLGRDDDTIQKKMRELAELQRHLRELMSTPNVLNAGIGGRTMGGPSTEKPSVGEVPNQGLWDAMAKERTRAAEFAARALVQIEEESAQTAAEAWQYWDKAQLDAHQRTVDATKLQWQQVFEFIDAEQERAIELGQAAVAEVHTSWSVFGEQAARNIQDALGNTIEDTLTGRFDNVLELWKNLLARMAAEAIAADLGRQLFGDFGSTGRIDGIAGTLLKYLGLERGGAFAGGAVQPFASGGILGPLGGLLTRPTIFPMANGWGLAGEAGTEAVMPLRRGRDGKLGVAATTAAPTMNFYSTVNVGAGVPLTQVVAAVQAGNRQLKAEIMRDQRRGGA